MPTRPMNRDKPARQRRERPKPTRLQRQAQQKTISTPRQQARAHILAQLHDLVVACDELFDQHGEACCCETCALVTNFVGALRIFEMLLAIT